MILLFLKKVNSDSKKGTKTRFTPGSSMKQSTKKKMSTFFALRRGIMTEKRKIAFIFELSNVKTEILSD